MYCDYVVILGYRTERDRLDKQANRPYLKNQHYDERPKKTRERRFKRFIDSAKAKK